MKKIITVLILLISLININVLAADFSTSITGNTSVSVGERVTYIFNITSINNLTALTAKLNYDQTKLKLISSVGMNNFSVIVGTNIVADHTEGMTGNFGFIKLTFEVLSSFKNGESTALSISELNGSNGMEDLSGTGCSITIKGIEMPVNETSTSKANETVVKVAPKTTNTTVATKTESLSNNNNLKAISIIGFELNFKPDVLNYNLRVEDNVDKIDITAFAEDDKATVSINNIEELAVGNNQINIIVKAENGDEKKYKLNVTKKISESVITLNNNKDEIKDDNTFIIIALTELFIMIILLFFYIVLYRKNKKIMNRIIE